MAVPGAPVSMGDSTAWNPGAVAEPVVSLVSTSPVSVPDAARWPAMIPKPVPGSWPRWILTTKNTSSPAWSLIPAGITRPAGTGGTGLALGTGDGRAGTDDGTGDGTGDRTEAAGAWAGLGSWRPRWLMP